MEKKVLAKEDQERLLQTLKERFEQNMERHKGLTWDSVQARLEVNPAGLWSLHEMERTSSEPDVVGVDEQTGGYIYVDCAKETPSGRTNLCYDDEALESRKKNKPTGSALGVAKAMGIEILTEEEYFKLQELGEFDNKTSSWVYTPQELRKLGGALFGDRRFGRVFIYHNGAESYYSARGFRGKIQV